MNPVEQMLKEVKAKQDKHYRFKKAVAKLCKEHGVSISHEDGHGAFMIEPYSESNICWFLAAYDKANETG